MKMKTLRRKSSICTALDCCPDGSEQQLTHNELLDEDELLAEDVLEESELLELEDEEEEDLWWPGY